MIESVKVRLGGMILERGLCTFSSPGAQPFAQASEGQAIHWIERNPFVNVYHFTNQEFR